MLIEIFYWLQIISAFLILVLVVLQPSKGSDLGSMAGGSSSNGNKSFIDPLTKITGAILIAYLSFSFLVSWSSVHLNESNESKETTITTEQGDK